jgi:hypothetical protein
MVVVESFQSRHYAHIVLMESFQSWLEAEGVCEDMVLVEPFQSRRYARGDVTSELMHVKMVLAPNIYCMQSSFSQVLFPWDIVCHH